MDTGATSGIALFFQAVQALGVVGVLAWLVYQFHRGTIIPRNVADQIIEVYKEEATNTFKAIMDRLDKLAEAGKK